MLPTWVEIVYKKNAHDVFYFDQRESKSKYWRATLWNEVSEKVKNDNVLFSERIVLNLIRDKTKASDKSTIR